MKRMFSGLLLLALALGSLPVQAQTKFPFRLNWTLYGEHAPFFVARDKGFYREEGLEVEIQEGSGSTTVAQLVANATSPVAYVDAATMMRGVGAGMPIKAVGVTLQQAAAVFVGPVLELRRRRGQLAVLAETRAHAIQCAVRRRQPVRAPAAIGHAAQVDEHDAGRDLRGVGEQDPLHQPQRPRQVDAEDGGRAQRQPAQEARPLGLPEQVSRRYRG